ncbi:phosphatase PAP2 family protein [Streptomyces sp. NPDC093260]|uniref:phosphatase PAP2 family protein n=1 Tax=Streptomyces sp. NPDC093260 TaxID=3155073 RepID=UPI0034447802
MTTSSPPALALDGASIDGGLYTDVTDFARHTHWLNGAAAAYSSVGMGVFAVILLVAWWRARREGNAVMTAVLATPFAVIIAYVANTAVKDVFQEPRPCRALPHDFLIEACPPVDDYAFPSNHTTVAFAFVAALFLINRRLGQVALLAAVVMGASRVYVGAHYPHDVGVGALVGTVVSLLVVLAARRFCQPLVQRLRDGALRPLLTAAAPSRHAAGRTAEQDTDRTMQLGRIPAPASGYAAGHAVDPAAEYASGRPVDPAAGYAAPGRPVNPGAGYAGPGRFPDRAAGDPSGRSVQHAAGQGHGRPVEQHPTGRPAAQPTTGHAPEWQ